MLFRSAARAGDGARGERCDAGGAALDKISIKTDSYCSFWQGEILLHRTGMVRAANGAKELRLAIGNSKARSGVFASMDSATVQPSKP